MMCEMTIDEMRYEIVEFINTWRGTAIGQEVSNRLDNTSEYDYEGHLSIYEDLSAQGLL